MKRKRPVANLLGLAVLAYLTQRPMHPYEIARAMAENDDSRSIKFTHGSLYMVVGQLARAGFIAVHETTRKGQLPERTLYALTDSGRRELHDWMRDLVAEPDHEYPQFVAALSLIAALPPDEVVELLTRRLDRLARRRAEIREMVDATVAKDVHPLFLIEEEYRLALLEAESAFVEGFIQKITEPRTGWGRLWEEMHRPRHN
jgi:DNA-binding PadR family transcriptional regulator